jgi:DNA-binding response OmpR family regulator
MSEYPSLHGTTVLIVEDELLQALDTAECLSDAGARVIGPVSTISEATRLVRQNECCAVILDLQVNDGNCLNLARQLLQAGKAVIVLTGYPPQHIPLRDSACCQVIFKPAPASDILAALDRLVISRGKQEVLEGATFIAA